MKRKAMNPVPLIVFLHFSACLSLYVDQVIATKSGDQETAMSPPRNHYHHHHHHYHHHNRKPNRNSEQRQDGAEDIPTLPPQRNSTSKKLQSGCQNMWCKPGHECRIDSYGDPTCICSSVCHPTMYLDVMDEYDLGPHDPVCSSDGTVYSNLCQMYYSACVDGKDLTIKSMDECKISNSLSGDFPHQPYDALDVDFESPSGLGSGRYKEDRLEDSLIDWISKDNKKFDLFSEEELARRSHHVEDKPKKKKKLFKVKGKGSSSSTGPKAFKSLLKMKRKTSPLKTKSDKKSFIAHGVEIMERGSSLCSREEYEILKSAILKYNAKTLSGKVERVQKSWEKKREEEKEESNFHNDLDNASGTPVQHERREFDKKEILLSLMFANFDSDNNGVLTYAELQNIGFGENLGDNIKFCHPVEFLKYEDSESDSVISPNEFSRAFSANELPFFRDDVNDAKIAEEYSDLGSPVALSNEDDEDTALPKTFDYMGEDGNTIHIMGTIGGSVRIKCAAEDTGNLPYSPVNWYRYGVDVTNLIVRGETMEIDPIDGTLLIKRIQFLHSGNYSCRHQLSSGNEKSIQAYKLSVQSKPEVKVRDDMIWKKLGDEVTLECRASGFPTPEVSWLKNDNPLSQQLTSQEKYHFIGDGIGLTVRDINFSDTGAFMCQAKNVAGENIDISSLVVINENGEGHSSGQRNSSRFLVLHDRGISLYDPEDCHLQRQILSNEIVPGTKRDYICGPHLDDCEWGRAKRVSSTYVYLSQPDHKRLLILSLSQMEVVDFVITEEYPVELDYIPHLDQLWVSCWINEYEHTKKIQVIKDAKLKKKHYAKSIPHSIGQFNTIRGIYVPKHSQFRSAYVTLNNFNGLVKLDLKTLRFVKSIDLSPFDECFPTRLRFTLLYGYVVIDCKVKRIRRPPLQLVMDALSDSVIGLKQHHLGQSYLSPDSRQVITLSHRTEGSTLVCQHVQDNGVRHAFDVRVPLNLSDIAFYPSQRFHSYDLFASVIGKEAVLFVDLQTGNIQLVPGVGKSTSYQAWNRPIRIISSSYDPFEKYLVTASRDSVYVLNGRSHTVNCQIGGFRRPQLFVWL